MCSWAVTGLETRKAVCPREGGGVMIMGGAISRGWSTHQAVIAWSNAEAEYCVALKGPSIVLGLKSVAKGLGLTVSLELHTDSLNGAVPY